MVLTATMSPPPKKPVQRGTTLPPNLKLDLQQQQQQQQQQQHTVLATSSKSNTLPSYSARVQEMNQVNRQQQQQQQQQQHRKWHSADQPLVSRNAPASVSILSLPNSDNEALNFENR